MLAGYRSRHRGLRSLGEPKAQRTLPEPEVGMDRFCNRGRQTGKFTRQGRTSQKGNLGVALP